MAYDEAVRERAIQLRTQEHMGLANIATTLGIAKGTASLWLQDHPLPAEVLAARRSANGKASSGRRKACDSPHVREITARFREVAASRSYTTSQMGAIAETAALLRLHTHQFEVFRPTRDGSKVDLVVLDPPTGRTMKVQVKCAKQSRSGLPVVSLLCGMGSRKFRRYTVEEFDFIVGYDITTDTCFVWSFDEVSHLNSSITITPEAAERWDKFIEV